MNFIVIRLNLRVHQFNTRLFQLEYTQFDIYKWTSNEKFINFNHRKCTIAFYPIFSFNMPPTILQQITVDRYFNPMHNKVRVLANCMRSLKTNFTLSPNSDENIILITFIRRISNRFWFFHHFHREKSFETFENRFSWNVTASYISICISMQFQSHSIQTKWMI